jgi:hypothetical protein
VTKTSCAAGSKESVGPLGCTVITTIVREAGNALQAAAFAAAPMVDG